MQAQTVADRNFDWNERWRYYLHRTYSWQRMATLSAESAFDHAIGSPDEWNREAGYFGARFGSALGRRMVRNSIEFGAGGALREDTRFRASGGASLKGRLGFAFLQSVTATRGDRRVFSWSRLAATAGAVALCSGWGRRPLGPGRFAEGMAFSYMGQVQNSLLAEFGVELKKLGRGVRRRILRSNEEP